METREDPSVRGGKLGGERALHSEKVSAAELQLYLKGIDYPADKNKLIETAQNNDAPDNVMQWIQKLPDRTYNRANQVEEEFGKMK